MSNSPAPGQVWWNARLCRYAVVYDVWVRSARVVLMSPNYDRPPTVKTWRVGPPRGWVLYYRPGRGMR